MKTLKIIFSILIIIASSRTVYSIPEYNLRAMNFIYTSSNTIEFDIYIQHIYTVIDPVFNYHMGQYMFNINPDFANYGTLSYSIVSGFVSLDYPQVFVTETPVSGIQLRLTSLGPDVNGTIVSMNYPGTRIAKMRLTTTATNFCGNLDIQWRNKLDAGGFYTKIFSSDKFSKTFGTNITPLVSPNHFIVNNLISVACDSCSCYSGLLENWNFANYSIPGPENDLYPSGNAHADPWHSSFATPQLNGLGGYCDSGYIEYWGHSTNGEVISQSGFNIVKGRTYQICMSVRLAASQTNYGRIGVTFTGTTASTTYPPTPNSYNGLIVGGNAPTTPPIGSPGITSTTWTKYCYNWTATGNFTQINLNPLNDNSGGPTTVSWMDIDNICINEIRNGCDSAKICALTRCPADSFTVCIASSISPYNIVNCDVAYTDSLGCAYYNFPLSEPGVSYYIVVKNKNSIETWSATPQIIYGNNCLEYDFTTDSSKAFGNNMVKINGKWTLHSGDVDQDGFVDGTDEHLVDHAAFNSKAGGLMDLNCDGIVDGTDLLLVDNSSYSFASVMKPGPQP